MRIVSGMRPTGKLHIGHYYGAIKNWIQLQKEHDCYFLVADWHALTSDYQDTSNIPDNIIEMVAEMRLAGIVDAFGGNGSGHHHVSRSRWSFADLPAGPTQQPLCGPF